MHSRDAAFEIKKGELFFGYQPFATKDPKVFEDPEEFMSHRFVREGEIEAFESNGREIDDPTVENKQCPRKDLVLLLSRVMLVELFLCYDTFTIKAGTLLLGSSATFTLLTKATSNYGLPFFGPIKDRLDYFYHQGKDTFFQTRIQEHQSTVFRTNMPPGPFISSNSNVIALLDAISFPILFDTSKVQKLNVLVGTYMPSTALTGGYRVCAYLDPSEPKHALLKRLIFSILASLHDKFIPLFRNCLSELFVNLEDQFSDKGKVYFNTISDKMSFDFVFRLFCDQNPLNTRLGSKGEKLHRELCDEIRTIVSAEGGVTFSALEKMTLTKSVVYEALRIEPPVAFQYGKAKEDLVVHSHDAAFEIKKGEMIFGYQPFATKDPKVFEDPEEFVGHRFVGEGKKLLKYVYWSNGREIDDPTVENKQCPGKDLVVLLSRVMLVELFLRYDTFTIEAGTLLLGSSATFTSLTKATSI
ncbi:allene oxide synthase 3 [Quercus suber]|uniref:Allene oxide synthase 3 n=1 Tax=Quercus suber TaxID=58331 RepID=A0AAW0JUZ5_QUESU